MVGSPPPYPYLTQIGTLSTQSTLQLANLSSVNARYRRNSPNYRAFSTPSRTLSPAQQQLQGYQDALSKAANPYAPKGAGYQRLAVSALPAEVDPRIGALLSRLQAQNENQTSYAENGSRYVLADIVLKQDTESRRDYLNNKALPRRGAEYRLHYYQDSRQEIVLLQDISNRNTELSLNETPRGVLHALQREQSILGAHAPALYQSGTMQAGFGYNSNQDLILQRKAGDTQYRASNINETGTGLGSEAKTASRFLEQKLARLAKTQNIQSTLDDILETGSDFVITTPRSQRNLEAIRKNSRDVTEFFPGLRQGFGFDGSSSNRRTAAQILGDHYRMKYLSQAQAAPEGIARAYSNSGINPALYTDYSALRKSRNAALNLPTSLPEDRSSTRYQHLMSDGVLHFSNFQTVISDTFQTEDGLVIGSIGLIDAPIRSAPAIAPLLSSPPVALRGGFNSVNNIAGSVLSRLTGIVSPTVTRQLVAQKLGSGGSGGYDALLQGNIDVSSTLITGLGNTTATGNSNLYIIDAAGIAARSDSGIDISWQGQR